MPFITERNPERAVGFQRMKRPLRPGHTNDTEDDMRFWDVIGSGLLALTLTAAPARAHGAGERLERRGARVDRRGERVERRGERQEARGQRIETRGQRIENRGERMERGGEAIESGR